MNNTGNAIFLVNDENYVDKDSYLDPEIMDIMLTDLNHAKISNISRFDFGFEYNSPTTDDACFPIQGFIHVTPYGRNIIPLIVKYKNRKIKTVAISDTGNPYVYLSEKTFTALGVVDTTHANVELHGETTFVHLSTNHFSDVNVVGASFFIANRLIVTSDYDKNTIIIEKRENRKAEL